MVIRFSFDKTFVSQVAKLNKLVKSFLGTLRSGSNILIRSTASNRIVTSKETTNLSTKLTRLISFTNVKVSVVQYCSGR